MKESVGLSSIGQLAFTVSDLAGAVRFYRDALGLKFLFETPNLAFFDCGGVRLMLSLPERGTAAQQSDRTIAYFEVDALSETYEILQSRGVKFENEPHLIARMPDHELWMAFFRDPEGNLFGLMAEVQAV